MPFGLMLADSHVPFRRELRRVIEANPGLRIIGEADDCVGLQGCLQSLSPDLILIDLFTPDFRGIESILDIRKSHPDAKILVLTMYGNGAYISRALAAGADGYLLKENVPEELIAAIESIQKGRKYVSPALDVKGTE
jgi:DNA-binding NarL/FixJ family response regulator